MKTRNLAKANLSLAGAKAVLAANALLLLAGGHLRAAPTFDDFSSDPNISTEWTEYEYFDFVDTELTWNNADGDLDLSKFEGNNGLGLSRTDSSRAATDPVTLTVKELNRTGGTWGFLGLMISEFDQPGYVTTEDDTYTLALIAEGGTSVHYEVRRTYLDGTGDFQLYVGSSFDLATNGPVTLDIIRNGAGNYEFLADGNLLYTSGDAPGDFYDAAALDSLVNYQIVLNGDSAIDATVDDFGVPAGDTPPVLASLNPLSPADDATDVPTYSDLVVTFDDLVVFGTGNITIKESVGDAVVEAFDVTTSPNLLRGGASVTINPITNLASSTGYYVQIDPEAIDDTSGNSFTGITDTTTWSFTTAGADVTEPVGAVDSPANGATGVSPGDNLAITFDEPVQKGVGNIVIRRTDDDTVVDTIDVATAAVIISGGQVTIIPTAALPVLIGLYVEIDPGAFLDLAGNPFAGISGSGTWNFTAAPRTDLGTLTPFTGGDAGEGLDLSGNIIYAFNLGGTQTVQGIEFVDASLGDPPAGITTTAGFNFDYTGTNGGENAADYGDSADDDALENITTVIWYDTNWTFDLEVVPGTQYQLQLILQEGWFPAQGSETRIFDISVERTLAVDDLVLGIETDGAGPAQPDADFGLVYTYTFTATDSSFRVDLDESVDGSLAVLTAVILQEPVSAIPFAITEIDHSPEAVTLTWTSRPGATYSIESSADLQNWLELDDGIESGGEETTFEHTPDAGTTILYYRVRLGQ